jgi:hypothetical protein
LPCPNGYNQGNRGRTWYLCPGEGEIDLCIMRCIEYNGWAQVAM